MEIQQCRRRTQLDASHDFVFIDNQDMVHTFFIVSSGKIKPKHSCESQMFLGLLDCLSNYGTGYGLHCLGGGEDSCKSFIRKSLNDNNRIKFMDALNVHNLEYYSDDVPTYLPYAMLQNNNIRTVANSLFKNSLNRMALLITRKISWKVLRKLFMNLWNPGTSVYNAHNAKDLEKLNNAFVK